jgi:hypothetical protein
MQYADPHKSTFGFESVATPFLFELLFHATEERTSAVVLVLCFFIVTRYRRAMRYLTYA